VGTPLAAVALATAPAPSVATPVPQVKQRQRPSSVEFDVELLPVPASAPVPQRGLLVITNRDWFFLALGAGGVIFAGLVGFALAWILRG
jgi:hypothetical protein